jgi:phage terminase large subunit-like protein
MIIKGLENKSFFYDSKKAHRAINFIEKFAHHHEGALAPQNIKLELWQKALISCIFGIVDEDGTRHFREVLCVIGRKNGKTLLDASIADYMAFCDGEYGARLYFIAPKLQQASLCYDALYQMIKKEPDLDVMTKRRRTDIYIESTNTTAQPLAFSQKKSDGLNPSFVSCDEIASWQGQAGLKQYEVLKSALGARKQPLILSISTAGYESEGIYDELIKRSTRVLLGESKESRLLPVLYMIDDVEKWNDINELQKSNPNLNVSISVDYLLEEIAVAEGSLSKKTEFVVKYCNIRQNSSQAWLSMQAVEKCVADIHIKDFAHCYCVGGIDLSRTTDLTSACVVIEKDGVLNVFSHFWLPSEKIDEAQQRDGVPYKLYVQQGYITPSGENFVDYNDCFKWFTHLVEEYEILPLMVGYDRYTAQYLIQQMQAYGFQCDDVYQGFNLSPVITEMEGLLEDGKIRYATNPLLKMHLLDTALKKDTESNKQRIIKIDSTCHIDGTASLLDALTVRQKWCGQFGSQLENK